MTTPAIIDSHTPRFSQALQAVLLAVAFVFDARVVVPAIAAVMVAALVGGPRWNLFARLYRALPIPRGEPEPAAPPRFAQMLGAAFLAIATVALFVAARGSTAYDVVGWGPALIVAVLAGVAATTNF